jgi:hypothetical protein
VAETQVAVKTMAIRSFMLVVLEGEMRGGQGSRRLSHGRSVALHDAPPATIGSAQATLHSQPAGRHDARGHEQRGAAAVEAADARLRLRPATKHCERPAAA